MRTRHNPMSAKFTDALMHANDAHEPRYDQDGRIIWDDPRIPTLTEVAKCAVRTMLKDKAHAPGLRAMGLDEPDHWVRMAPADYELDTQWIKLDRQTGEANYIGWWMRQHYRKIAKATSTRFAADCMCVRGYPIHITLLVLTGTTNPKEE